MQEPSVEIEIRWCPAHKGIPGNEVADGWVKQAASEPDELANGDWLPHGQRKKGKPDLTPARVEKRMASRFYQLKSGHACT